MQARAFGAQVPGSACVHPWPSQTPELQLALSTHGWPSATSRVETGSLAAGGVVSVGVGGSPAGGGVTGGGGDDPAVPAQAALAVIRATSATFSNSLWRMAASYTLRDG